VASSDFPVGRGADDAGAMATQARRHQLHSAPAANRHNGLVVDVLRIVDARIDSARHVGTTTWPRSSCHHALSGLALVPGRLGH
jgi:hypothetical protein